MRTTSTLSALLITVFVVGAANAGAADLTPKAVSKIRVGQTTQDDIERKFGEPQDMKISGKGQIWTYVQGASTGKKAAGSATKAAGGALSKIPGGWGGMVPKPKAQKTKPTVLKVKFDPSGVVKDFDYQQSK